MDFPNYFADAEADFEDSKFVIFGVPYDRTSTFRKGASKGPYEIRKASWNFETFNMITGNDLKEVNFHDFGDLDVIDDEAERMIEKVQHFSKKLISKNKFPIALGGEHSITPAIIQSFPKDIYVVSLDAHIDFRKEYENNKFNHACAMRRVADYVGVDNVSVLGIRSAEKEEFINAKKDKLSYIDSFEIKKNGIHKALEKTKNKIKGKKIYLTLDIDVLDLSYAPGTSTPEPFGLSSFDVYNVIKFFSPQLIGFDVVEVCPSYDYGQTALLAAKFVRFVIESVYFSK